MLSDLFFRPVHIDDKPRILDFTAHTWGEDEDDYIQYVFDDWLADPNGEFTAAELDGQVVGIAKLTDLGSGQWWFEGLRVDPAHRRQGIAEAIHRYQVDLARRLGGVIIRYMTSGDNIGSQVIGAKTGFQHVLTYIFYTAGAIADVALPTLLTLSDLPALRAWLDSPLLHYTHRLHRKGWAARTLEESEIKQLLESGQVYGIKDEAGQVKAWANARAEVDEEPDRLKIDHIDGELDSIRQLAQALRSLAASQQKKSAGASLVDYPPLLQIMAQAGYRPDPGGFQMWVMELKL